MGKLFDWHIWRAFVKGTSETLGLRVVRKGESASGAFTGLTMRSNQVIDFERRATVYHCTEDQAIDVMNTLNQDVLGMPN
jgi:hypothetical protein